MDFCDVCHNMLYVQVQSEESRPTLVHACRNCGFKTSELGQKSESLSVADYSTNDKDDAIFKQFITPYIKFDPTLPRVDNIQCPSDACKKRGGDRPEVIYIKVDYENMKYIYYCCKCEHFWRMQTT